MDVMVTSARWQMDKTMATCKSKSFISKERFVENATYISDV